MNYMKFFIKLVVRCLLKLFCIFPIKQNRVFFESFGGKLFSCNPYYIYKNLKERCSDIDFVWVARNDSRALYDSAVQYVNYTCFKYFYYRLTSKVVVCNDFIPVYFPSRKSQLVIDTWHGGGAYKRVGIKQNREKKCFYKKLESKLSVKGITYFLSSSKKFTEIISDSMLIPESKFLPIGMPRNDIFFDTRVCNCINKEVRKKLRINDDVFVILYAPTFRGTTINPFFDASLNIESLKHACRDKFRKDVIVIFRGHHAFVNSHMGKEYDFDVSNYPDIQELLCMADMLITDYSSSMWDFSFTYKPCFLFVPDLNTYMENPGFYTSPESWGFPLAQTNNELAECINMFDHSAYKIAMERHHTNLISYEQGTATEKICELILTVLHK